MLKTKVIGRQATEHGEYAPGQAYGKKFIVTLFDCGWESKHDNNTSAPATLNAQTGTITENTTDWKKKWGSYEQWLIDNGYQKTDATNVKDGNNNQHQINASFANEIGSDSTPESIKGRITNLEEAVGSGGSVDERIAEEGARHYLKSETYTKEEVNGLVTTPNQEFVTVEATDQTTAATDVLPATGAADTIYRVANWDGSQYDASVYSEYAWNGTLYIHLSTKTQIGEVFDISAYHATGGTLATYTDLADALTGTNGGVPQSLQKGGMSVKFVSSIDNKYIQARCMAQNFTTDVTQWQGADDEPTAGSQNFITSGGSLKILEWIYSDELNLRLLQQYIHISSNVAAILEQYVGLINADGSINPNTAFHYTNKIPLKPSTTYVVGGASYINVALYDINGDFIRKVSKEAPVSTFTTNINEVYAILMSNTSPALASVLHMNEGTVLSEYEQFYCYLDKKCIDERIFEYIDESDENLYKLLSNLAIDIYKESSDFYTKEGYYNVLGTFITGTAGRCTEPIEYKGGDIIACGRSEAANAPLMVFFGEDGTTMTGFYPDPRTADINGKLVLIKKEQIPAGTYFVCFNGFADETYYNNQYVSKNAFSTGELLSETGISDGVNQSADLVKSSDVFDSLFEQRSSNLADTLNITPNRVISQDGSIVENNSYNTSDYIHVDVGETYVEQYITFIATYTKKREFIKRINPVFGTAFTFDNNVEFIRLSSNNQLKNWQLNKGDVLLDYEPYAPPVNRIYELKNSIYKASTNLANPTNALVGKVILADGSIVDNASYITSDFIKVEPGADYSCKRIVNLACYSKASNDAFISRITAHISDYVTIPTNAEYVRISTNYSIDLWQMNKGKVLLDYEPWYATYNKIDKNTEDIEELQSNVEKLTDNPIVKFEFSHDVTPTNTIGNIIEGLDPNIKIGDGERYRDIMWQLYDKFDALMALYPDLITKIDLVGSGYITFAVGDFVEYNNNLYKCLVACDDTQWVAANFESVANWASSTGYALDDVVFYDKTSYKCIEAHTSENAFDDTKWERIVHKYFGYPEYARLNGVPTSKYTAKCPSYHTYMYRIKSTNVYAGNIEGRKTNKKKMLIIGATHGIEVASSVNTYILASLLCKPEQFDYFALQESYDIYIIPVLNGYGSYRDTRANANNVDINRNYPVKNWTIHNEGQSDFTGYIAGSEFENQLIMALCNNITFDIAIDHHNYWPNLPKQYYTDVADENLIPITYQSLTDISFALIKAYPQYFGTKPKLFLEQRDSAPGYITINGGTTCRWWYEKGIGVASTLEICNAIAYENGEHTSKENGVDTYGPYCFSVGQYSLINQLCRFAEFIL